MGVETNTGMLIPVVAKDLHNLPLFSIGNKCTENFLE